MQITTQVQTSDPNYPYDATQAASQVLAALGGNPTTDTSAATVRKVSTLITTNVNLGSTDHLAYTPAQAATQVLAALAGNPTKDTCVVVVAMPMAEGKAGVAPAE
jgi:hypothetical protein